MNNPNVPPKILLPLDHTRVGPMADKFYEFLKTRAVGQPRIFKWCVETLEAVLQGFYPERGPAASVLLVGPSGVGKTYIASLLAEFLFGEPEGFSRVDGQDLSLEHNVARLVGAPAGYIGYGDEPMITQRKLDLPAHRTITQWVLGEQSEQVRKDYVKFQKERAWLMRHLTELHGTSKPDVEKQKLAQTKLTAIEKRIQEIGIPEYDRTKYEYLSVLLIDEIEREDRSADNLWLRVLDEGKLPLASKQKNNENSFIDFRRTIIIATSNLGTDTITKTLQISSGRSAGYRFVNEKYTSEQLDWEIYRTCRNAVDKFFPTEFVNRFGDVIAARPHSKGNLLEILDIEIEKLRERLSSSGDLNFPVTLHVDQNVKEYLVDEVADHPEKGIRFLQQKLSARILRAISTLKSTDQLSADDILHVSLDPSSKKLLFQKEERGKLLEHIVVVE
jgi:ATP-dependent Clp protease ATP-binding subunit ClpA